MERRNSPRLVVNHPVWIIGFDRKSESDEQRLGYAIDVSESGMLLEIQGNIVENRIKVFASTINSGVIEIAGRIVAIGGSGSGYSRIRLKFEGNFQARRSFYDDFMQTLRLKQRPGSHSTQED
jgi:hypothetical protein